MRETPYGSVDRFHEGAELHAWWIEKEHEEIDPAWSTCDREDLLHVVEGTLRLELEGRDPVDLPAGSVRFLAVAPADATFS